MRTPPSLIVPRTESGDRFRAESVEFGDPALDDGGDPQQGLAVEAGAVGEVAFMEDGTYEQV
jgi:hypothetical protein